MALFSPVIPQSWTHYCQEHLEFLFFQIIRSFKKGRKNLQVNYNLTLVSSTLGQWLKRFLLSACWMALENRCIFVHSRDSIVPFFSFLNRFAQIINLLTIIQLFDLIKGRFDQKNGARWSTLGCLATFFCLKMILLFCFVLMYKNIYLQVSYLFWYKRSKQ